MKEKKFANKLIVFEGIEQPHIIKSITVLANISFSMIQRCSLLVGLNKIGKTIK